MVEMKEWQMKSVVGREMCRAQKICLFVVCLRYVDRVIFRRARISMDFAGLREE